MLIHVHEFMFCSFRLLKFKYKLKFSASSVLKERTVKENLYFCVSNKD